MAGPQEIVIDIETDGTVTIEGKNFEGGECTKFTAEIEQALGKVTQRTLKPEYHRAKTLTRKVGS